MKVHAKQITSMDVYNLIAHETVSLLEALDGDAIPPALEMRSGLAMLASANGMEESIKTHLDWIDKEIENLKQTAGTSQYVTHLIPTPQLVRTANIVTQIDAVLEFFRTTVQVDSPETRTALLDLARTTTDMCGMDECLSNSGDNAAKKMVHVWAIFSEAVNAESRDARQVLLQEAETEISDLHGLVASQTELEDGRIFMSANELQEELDEVAKVLAPSNQEMQLS